MSDVGQKVREEMWVFLLSDFERTVTDKRELFFSKFTFLHIFKFVHHCQKTWPFVEKRVPEVKGKAMDMRFFLFRVSSIKYFAYKIHLLSYSLRLTGSYPAIPNQGCRPLYSCIEELNRIQTLLENSYFTY